MRACRNVVDGRPGATARRGGTIIARSVNNRQNTEAHGVLVATNTLHAVSGSGVRLFAEANVTVVPSIQKGYIIAISGDRSIIRDKI